MPIDFGKINSGNTSNTALHPREIFTALPAKKEGKFEYPRDVQTQVWDHLCNLTADRFCEHYTTSFK